MNSLRNRVQLIGHVGQDPEIHELENGKKVARFSLATNEIYFTSKNEKVEKTYWHGIVFWDKFAESIEKHVKQGQQLAIEGKLVTRSWEDEDGQKHYRTEVVGKGIVYL